MPTKSPRPRRKLTHRRSNTRRSIKQSAVSHAAEHVASFDITDDNIQAVRRYLPEPKDCVINALELLRIIDPVMAGVMRIFVGKTGIQTEQMIKIFEFIYRRPFFLAFRPVNELNVLEEYSVNTLPVNKCIFVGVQYNDNTGHTFIIGKNNQGGLIYLDPQNPDVCDLRYGECVQRVFGNASSYFILTYPDYDILNPIVSPMELSD